MSQHIATYIGFGERLAIHDETYYVQYPQFGCPDTYDSDVDGENDTRFFGVVSNSISDLIEKLDVRFGEKYDDLRAKIERYKLALRRGVSIHEALYIGRCLDKLDSQRRRCCKFAVEAT